MPIEFVRGDLLEDDSLEAIAHGCNCAGAMGAGIAKDIRERWPAMFREYKRRCLAGQFTLGDVFVWTDNGRVVFNLGTQATWRTRASLPALETSVERMLVECEERGIHRVGLPRIGAGLGGLEWQTVKSVLIARASRAPNVMLVVYEEFVPRAERG